MCNSVMAAACTHVCMSIRTTTHPTPISHIHTLSALTLVLHAPLLMPHLLLVGGLLQQGRGWGCCCKSTLEPSTPHAAAGALEEEHRSSLSSSSSGRWKGCGPVLCVCMYVLIEEQSRSQNKLLVVEDGAACD